MKRFSFLMWALKVGFVLLTTTTFSHEVKTTDCEDGYYGRDCAYTCSSGCLNKRCITSANGADNCTEGCVDGYSGVSCRFQCPPFCRKCQRHTDSHCTLCKDYRYGLSCERSCRLSCPSTDCDTNGKCLPDDVEKFCGHNCKDCNMRFKICKACAKGFYGEMCGSKCSSNCGCPDGNEERTCASHCEQKTGNCSDGCIKPYFGNMCQFHCSEQCVDGICEQDTGVCINGCKRGYFGLKCESGCNEQCKHSLCHNVTGQCVNGCADGYFGVECTEECSKSCEYSICEDGTGYCSHGCTERYFGPKCEHKCEAGCSVCHRNSGECIITFNTTASVNSTYRTSIQSGATQIYYILGGVAVIFIVVTMASIIFSYRCCVKKAKGDIRVPVKPSTSVPKESYIDLNQYCEICEDDFGTGSRLSIGRDSSISYHPPINVIPSAPPCGKFLRALSGGCGDQERRSENSSAVARSDVMMDNSEGSLLESRESYMKMCVSGDLNYTVPQKVDRLSYLSAVGK